MSSGADRGRSLDAEGIRDAQIHWNLTEAVLYEHAVRRNEGLIAADGPLVCRTGQHTGRSPNDKFIVREPSSEQHIAWGGPNRPMSTEQFDVLHQDMLAALRGSELFVQDCYAGADPRYRLRVRVITEFAWHSLFARNLLITDEASDEAPELTIVDVPSFRADPARHGTNSSVVVALLSMHCSANVGLHDDTALFFGLSGTGKTTLSSDPDRGLIGDDEHGWSDHGVFNFEGGCYAKTIRLSADAEPQIYATTRRFGTVLENVVVDPVTRQLDLDSDQLTENTRAAYPISFISNAIPSGQGGHPRNIVMLTADAFGVLPPVSRLSPAAAMYHFLSGYTAKVAGTEKGVTEPKATFSTCFGAPFLPLAPSRYAELLGEKIARHDARVWLVNTGWSGGPYGVGARMSIRFTRAMIHAALSGGLDGVLYDTHPVFNLQVPQSCPDVPAEVLNPRHTWSDKAAYDAQAAKLARMFVDNFRSFEAKVSPDVVAAGPHA
jgi:phosphoenolpyruvate carboxykinase (ATP)